MAWRWTVLYVLGLVKTDGATIASDVDTSEYIEGILGRK
jgi:hypothetical protein